MKLIGDVGCDGYGECACSCNSNYVDPMARYRVPVGLHGRPCGIARHGGVLPKRVSSAEQRVGSPGSMESIGQL